MVGGGGGEEKAVEVKQEPVDSEAPQLESRDEMVVVKADPEDFHPSRYPRGIPEHECLYWKIRPGGAGYQPM
jgi:hypothetical protein